MPTPSITLAAATVTTAAPLLAADAARRLGLSVKALRLYEQHGLLRPQRTEAGYRRYSAQDLRAAQDVAALRALGLSLARIAAALQGDAEALDQALALREAELGGQFATLQQAAERLRMLRQSLSAGATPPAGELADVLGTARCAVAFDLPWPWNGEPFALPALPPLTYLVGPLGSGKTRLALQLADALDGAVYLAPQRLDDPAGALRELGLAAEETARADCHLDSLRDDGAVDLAPLRLLLAALEARGGRAPLVIDMIEDGLTRPSQEALMPFLRRHLKSRPAPVVAMTRSSAILDLGQVGPGEQILYCPANHDVPSLVPPFAGAPGYEALASCLATPEARERLRGGRSPAAHAPHGHQPFQPNIP